MMINNSTTYIYTLSDNVGNVRYVGKSDNIKRGCVIIFVKQKKEKTHIKIDGFYRF
jgi:hypothetical protein